MLPGVGGWLVDVEYVGELHAGSGIHGDTGLLDEHFQSR
jgi:hypothetical protein